MGSNSKKQIWLGWLGAFLLVPTLVASQTANDPYDPAAYFPDEPPGAQTAAFAGKSPSVDLELVSTWVFPGYLFKRPDALFQIYRQRLAGFPVDGTFVRYTSRMGERQITFSRTYSDIQVNLSGLLTVGEALTRAAHAVQIPAGGQGVRAEGSLIKYVQGKWRLVEEVSGPEVILYIDRNTGERFRRDPRRQLISGTIDGLAVYFDPAATGNNLDSLPLPDLALSVGGQVVAYTDAQGNYSFEPGTSSVDITLSLDKARYIALINAQGGILGMQGTIPNGTTGADGTFDPTDPQGNVIEFSLAQVNAFYHINRVRTFVKSLGLNPPGLDNPIRTEVNVSDVCNAFFAATSPTDLYFNFFNAGTNPLTSESCRNTAFDTIIYHEYGHYVDYLIGGVINGALSEGLGDAQAVFLSGQPLIGEGFYTDGTPLRTAQNNYQYVGDPNLPIHDEGQAFAGFAWDLLQALGGMPNGTQMVHNLVLHAGFSAANIPDAVYQVLVLDDDDGDLANGTPNSAAILQAAQNHSIQPQAGGNPPPNPNPQGGDPNFPGPMGNGGFGSSLSGGSSGCSHWHASGGGLDLGLLLLLVSSFIWASYRRRSMGRIVR